jgi:hypothetical protein
MRDTINWDYHGQRVFTGLTESEKRQLFEDKQCVGDPFSMSPAARELWIRCQAWMVVASKIRVDESALSSVIQNLL